MRRRRGGLGIGGDFGRAVWVASGESTAMKATREPLVLAGRHVRLEPLAEAHIDPPARTMPDGWGYGCRDVLHRGGGAAGGARAAAAIFAAMSRSAKRNHRAGMFVIH